MDQEQQLNEIDRANKALDQIIDYAQTAKDKLRVVRSGLLYGTLQQEPLDEAMNWVCVIVQDTGEHAHGCLLELGANGGL